MIAASCEPCPIHSLVRCVLNRSRSGVPSRSRNSSPSVQLKSALPCSQETATCPCPDAVLSSAHAPSFFKINVNIVIQWMPTFFTRSLSSGFPTKILSTFPVSPLRSHSKLARATQLWLLFVMRMVRMSAGTPTKGLRDFHQSLQYCTGIGRGNRPQPP